MRLRITTTKGGDFLSSLANQQGRINIGDEFQTEIGLIAKSATPPKAGYVEADQVWEFFLEIVQDVSTSVIVSWLKSKMLKHNATQLEIEDEDIGLSKEEIEKAIEEYRAKNK